MRTIIAVDTDLGLTGHGEADPAVDEVFDAVATAGVLVGLDPQCVALVADRAPAGLRVPLEMACLDVVGKATGRAVFELLGGKRRDRLPFGRPAAPSSPWRPLELDTVPSLAVARWGAELEGPSAARDVAAVTEATPAIAVVGLVGRIETGVGFAARLHVAATLPAVAFIESGQPDVVCDIIRLSLTPPRGGEVLVPPGPGLGICVEPSRVTWLPARPV